MSEEIENKVQEWQRLLGLIFDNEEVLLSLADDLGMHPDSLKRWTQGTIPRNPLRTLRSLLKAPSFPEACKEAFIEAVRKLWPDFEAIADPLLQDVPVKEIPSIFYSQIYRSFAYVAEDLVFWTLTNTVTHQMFGHLDSDRAAQVSVTLLLCTPPADNARVQSFYAPITQIGDRPSAHRTPFPILIGLESPLAEITPRYQRPLIFSEQDIQALTSLSFPSDVASLLSLPIQRRGKIAGCLLVSAQKSNYWNEQRALVAYEYGMLLGLAFRDQDFWSQDQLYLASYPPAASQQQQESRLPFRQRVIELWKEKRHLNQQQLEIVALQRLEQDLMEKRDE